MISRFFIIAYWIVLMMYNINNHITGKNPTIGLLALICLVVIVCLYYENWIVKK